MHKTDVGQKTTNAVAQDVPRRIDIAMFAEVT